MSNTLLTDQVSVSDLYFSRYLIICVFHSCLHIRWHYKVWEFSSASPSINSVMANRGKRVEEESTKVRVSQE